MANIILMIRQDYDVFTVAQKRIADYVLVHGSEFINKTAHELGELTGSSSASVVRFTQELGFDGIEQFKRQLAIDLNTKSEVVDPIINVDDNADDISKKLEGIILNSLQDLFFQLNKEVLSKAIEATKKANKVFIFGVGASSLPAYDLHHKLNRVNINSSFEFDNHMNIEFMNFAKDSDVVIIFTYSGNTIEALTAAKVAKAKGITTIVITADAKSSVAKIANLVMAIPKDEPIIRVGAITSKLNSLIIGDLLYLGVISSDLDVVEDYLIETNNLTAGLKHK